MIINYFFLKKKIEGLGISKDYSKKAIKKIRKMDKNLKKEFGKWYKYGKTPEREIDGIGFKTLVNTFGMNEINAFLTLDWLIREPEEAKMALISPVDTIIVSEKYREKNIPDSEKEDTSDLEIED